MAYEYIHEGRVEFSDTDMAGVVHFANFFRFVEAAEHAFFRSLGFELHEEYEGSMLGWVRGRVDCRYLRPLRYPQAFEVQLLVRAKGRASLGYSFAFRALGAGASKERVAVGTMDVVCVTRAPQEERIRVAPMPEEIELALEVAPPDLLEAIES